MDKPILYIDMDGVTVDFDKLMNKLLPNVSMGDGDDYEARSAMVDEVALKYPTLFEDMEPIEGAITTINILKSKYDIYFLSTPMCKIPESYMGKRKWLQKYFGEWVDKRLILTHRKDLVIGDILIDDRIKNGAGEFKGTFIQFGSVVYPNWERILQYLI